MKQFMFYTDQQLEHWLEIGFTVAEVARRTGLGYGNLYHRARSRGWNTSANKPRAVTPDQYDRVRELFYQGKTGVEIGIALGIGHECAYELLDWLGLEREPNRIKVDRIAALYKSGLCQSQIAQQLGMHQSNVSVALKTAGVACHRPIVVDVEAMVRLYEMGHTSRQITVALGCSLDSVYRHLNRKGYGFSRYWCKANTREVIRLYQEGYNCEQVGARLGVDRDTVRRYLKKAGIPRRQGRSGAARIEDKH